MQQLEIINSNRKLLKEVLSKIQEYTSKSSPRPRSMLCAISNKAPKFKNFNLIMNYKFMDFHTGELNPPILRPNNHMAQNKNIP